VTGLLVSPVIPPKPRLDSHGRRPGGNASVGVGRRVLSLPSLPATRARSAVYGFAAIDDRGRIAARHVIRSLDWYPISRLMSRWPAAWCSSLPRPAAGAGSAVKVIFGCRSRSASGAGWCRGAGSCSLRSLWKAGWWCVRLRRSIRCLPGRVLSEQAPWLVPHAVPTGRFRGEVESAAYVATVESLR
jgi:hypothetical protein